MSAKRKFSFVYLLVVLCSVHFAINSAKGQLKGSCSGTVTQDEPKVSYGVSMELQGNSGSINYPTVGCKGSLTFIRAEGSTYWYGERITDGKDLCIDGGTIQITLLNNIISWYWSGGGATASGTLTGDLEPVRENFQITIHRQSRTDQCTMGYMSADGEIFCYTLELPWKDNRNRISCIPEGTYNGILRYDKSDRWRIQLENVPNRTGVQIHIGNYTSEILGCVLVGTKASVDNCTVTDSRTAYAQLKKKFYGTPNPVSSPNLKIAITFE